MSFNGILDNGIFHDHWLNGIIVHLFKDISGEDLIFAWRKLFYAWRITVMIIHWWGPAEGYWYEIEDKIKVGNLS